MKNMTKFFALAVVIFGFSATSFAQSATATASGTIQPAYYVSKVVDMNFGSITPSASGGTLTLTADTLNVAASTVTGGVLSIGGTKTCALFSLFGRASGTYTVSVPNKLTITREGGTEIMDITAFTTKQYDLTAKGRSKLGVGATLKVGSIVENPAGTYTNPSGFQVTVNFN